MSKEVGAKEDRLNFVLDFAMQNVLEVVQKAVQILVNRGDDQALTALQSCVGEVFKGASECRREGKRMEIADDTESVN